MAGNERSMKVWVRGESSRWKNVIDYSKEKINGVSLRKLYIRNAPIVKNVILHKFFSSFGKVERVCLFRPNKMRKRAFAIVVYSSARDAVNVLKQKSVQFENRRMLVQPASAHCQPITCDSSSSEDEIEPDSSIAEENATIAFKRNLNNDSPIEILSDDSLRHIFSFLPLLMRIEMEKVCKRWKTVLRTMWCFRELNLREDIPCKIPDEFRELSTITQILKRCGTFLKQLNLQVDKISGADGLIEVIVCKCPVLEELRLKNVFLSKYSMKALKNLPNLKVISFSDCNSLTDEHLKTLVTLNYELKHIEIINNRKINGSFLRNIYSPLETLSFRDCSQLCSAFLLMGTERFQSTLLNLHLSNCEFLGDEGFNAIVERLPNLQVLDLSRYFVACEHEALNSITELKNLETLDLSFNQNVTYQFLSLLTLKCQQLKNLDLSGFEIAGVAVEDSEKLDASICGLSALKNLRSLKLSYLKQINENILKKYSLSSPSIESLFLVGCPNLVDSDIEYLLLSCLQLNYLDLSGCCQVTNNLVNIAQNALNSRTNDQPLCLVVGGTKIKDVDVSSCPLLTISYKDSCNSHWLPNNVFICNAT